VLQADWHLPRKLAEGPQGRQPGDLLNQSYASQAADWLREREHVVTGPDDPTRIHAEHRQKEMDDAIAY
jgi:hypothetical protein